MQLTEQLGDVNPTLEYNADEQIMKPPVDGFQLFKKLSMVHAAERSMQSICKRLVEKVNMQLKLNDNRSRIELTNHGRC